MAVYLVVAFHAGIGRLAGGFIGVDVFFVLSGYLVTTVLLRDLHGEGGRIRFGRFYARRARRLLPAAAVALVVTAVVFSSLGTTSELLDARSAIRAAALYVANWHFIHQASDYFAADIDASPVVHFWSLSVEEQFYLLWPLLLGGLFAAARRFGRRRDAVVRGVVVVLGLVSVGVALHLAGSNLNRAYYGTDTRAYQLLAGAALALTPALPRLLARRLPSWLLGFGSAALVLALGVAATSYVDINPVQRGVVAAILVCTLLASLEAAEGGLGRWALSLPPIVYLGRVSYGTYLWHWVVIVVIVREYPMSHVSTFVVASAIGTGLASLSYQLLELPIRSTAVLDRLRPVVISSGLALSLLVGLLIAPAVLDRPVGRTSAASATGTVTGGTAVDPTWQSAFFDVFKPPPGCEKPGLYACDLTDRGTRKVLLVGDSHSEQLAPTLTAIAKDHGIRLRAAFLSYCPWTRGVGYRGTAQDCFKQQDEVFDKIVPAFDPDVVILVHRAADDPNEYLDLIDRDEGVVSERDRPKVQRIFDRRIGSLVQSLRAQDRDVVMLEPVPVAPKSLDPVGCLAKAETVDACRFTSVKDPMPETLAMRKAADADPQHVDSIDLDPLVCPYLPICDPVIDGLPVRRDNNHITTTFWLHRRAEIEALLAGTGMLTAS